MKNFYEISGLYVRYVAIRSSLPKQLWITITVLALAGVLCTATVTASRAGYFTGPGDQVLILLLLSVIYSITGLVITARTLYTLITLLRIKKELGLSKNGSEKLSDIQLRFVSKKK